MRIKSYFLPLHPPVSVALPAYSPSLRALISVVFVKLMASLAMGARSLFGDPGLYRRTQAAGVHVANIGHNLFIGHSPIVSGLDCVRLQSRLSSEIRKKESSFWEFEPDRVSAIALLFKAACPSAIARLIVSAVIDSVKRITRWSRPHVDHKVLKAGSPTITNRDATSAIIMVLLGGWGIAAAEHALPDAVDRGWIF